jgi:F420-dependent oxidoreductase-like protein
MRIGVMVGGYASRIPVQGFIEEAQSLEARGFDTIWIPHVFGHDAITLCALVGNQTERIEVGTAVVPTYPRHPTAMAQQAMTAASASGGRFTLGIGLSHPPVIENMLGLSYARRARHMEEYMQVLGPLLRGEAARFQGHEFQVDLSLDVVDAKPVSVVIAALGPRMLEIAGRESDGTLLWMTGYQAIEKHVVPRLRASAEAAGRGAPRVIAGMHIVRTENKAKGDERMNQVLQQYQMMPSYKANIDREGSMTPDDFALIGNARELDEKLDRLAELGVTDFDANILEIEEGSRERTLEYLEARIAGGRGR